VKYSQPLDPPKVESGPAKAGAVNCGARDQEGYSRLVTMTHNLRSGKYLLNNIHVFGQKSSQKMSPKTISVPDPYEFYLKKKI